MITSSMHNNIVFYWRQNDWGMYGRRSEMIVRELSKRWDVNKIIYLEPPVNPYNVKSKWRLGKLLPVRWKKENNKLIVLTLVNVLGAFKNCPQWLTNLSLDILVWILKAFLTFHKINLPLLWICPPDLFGSLLVKKIRFRRLICDCIDDTAAYVHKGRDVKRSIETMYRDTLNRANLVFTTSEPLAKRFSKYNERIIFIPNAADVSLFSKVFGNQCKIDPTLSKIPPPVLGYVGIISERTDIDLLRYVAISRPQWQIVLVGPIHRECNISNLNDLKNIHFVGKVEYPKLPNFLAAFNVCLLPHKSNALSISMSPLKLYQYLASGLPVVSTELVGIEPYKHLMYIASEYPEFVKKIEEALSEDTIENRKTRLKVAYENRWEKRVNQIWGYVVNC